MVCSERENWSCPLSESDSCKHKGYNRELSRVWKINLWPHNRPLAYYHDLTTNASKATESNRQPCSTAQWQPHPFCVHAVQRGLDKEPCNVCDAACQHVMTKRRSAFKCTQPCSAPLNLSLFPPFPLSSLPPLYLMQNLPSVFPPLLFFFLLLLSSFCSFVLPWHIPQACWREGEGEEDRKEKKERGERVRKFRTRVQVIFYLIVVEKRIGRVSQQRDRTGDQRQTEWQRWRGWETGKKEGDRYVKRDFSVLGGVRSISLLHQCQLYFTHLCFLMFLFQLLFSHMLFCPFLLLSSFFCALSLSHTSGTL